MISLLIYLVIAIIVIGLLCLLAQAAVKTFGLPDIVLKCFYAVVAIIALLVLLDALNGGGRFGVGAAPAPVIVR